MLLADFPYPVVIITWDDYLGPPGPSTSQILGTFSRFSEAGFLQIFTDFSDFLGRLHPRQTRLQKPPNTQGVEESSSKITSNTMDNTRATSPLASVSCASPPLHTVFPLGCPYCQHTSLHLYPVLKFSKIDLKTTFFTFFFFKKSLKYLSDHLSDVLK